MFERMLEAKLASGPRGFSSASVSVAVAGHLTLAACLAAALFLVVESVDVPEPAYIPPLIVVLGPDAIPPRHPPGGGTPAAPRGGGFPRSQAPRSLPPPPPQDPHQPALDPVIEQDSALLDLSGIDTVGTDETFGSDGPDGPGIPGLGNDPRGVGVLDGLGSGIGDTPMLVTGEVVPPELVHRVQPRYPEAARIPRLSGRVILKAVIGLDGKVEGVEVLSTTHPVFEEAAVAAVTQWRYSPARYHGLPVAVFFTVTVNFVMR